MLLLLSETTAPPAGAGPLSTTVPWELYLPVTVEGFNVSDVGTKLVDWMVKFPVFEIPPPRSGIINGDSRSTRRGHIGSR